VLAVVAGGTGGLGKRVVAELAGRGHDVRVLSRHGNPDPAGGVPGPGRVSYARADLRSGSSLGAAVAGADVVVDTVNAQRKAESVLVEGTKRLAAAAAAGGVGHIVEISIVGTHLVAPAFGYYATKLAQERVIAECGVPWTLLRATQFHGFVGAMLRKLAAPPVMLVPSGKVQTVSVDEVAAALADAAGAGPAGRLPDVAGPEVADLAQLAQLWLGAEGKRRVVASVPVPGTFGRMLRKGALCNPARAVGKQTFADWLAANAP